MEILSYFKPEGLIAEIIVWVLLIIFVGWVLFLAHYWYQLFRSRQKVQRCADVSVLVDAFKKRLLQQSEAYAGQSLVPPSQASDAILELAAPPPPRPLSVPTQRDADGAFKEFCRINHLEEDETLAVHIRAIFNAGWNDSHLEVEGLVNNTASELLRRNSAFRSVLSVFIIIGLLGTLFGLASTLAQLAQDIKKQSASAPVTQSGIQPSTASDGNPSSDDVKKSLDTMLARMQSAFSPSILGVLFSVLSVLLFAIFQHRASSRLRNDLARHTYIYWVPALLPTPAQTLQEKLQLSEQQIQKSLDSALKIAALSDEIKDDASELNQAIKGSKSSLTKLTEASTNLSSFSENFIKAVNSLTPFQGQLEKLYEQMSTESRLFQDSVKKNIQGAEAFQKNIETQLNEQNRQLPIILKAFEAYETAYVESRQGIDANLKGLLDKLDVLLTSANQTFENLGERNKEITSGVVTALGNPLREDLARGLKEVKDALDARLSTVSQDLKGLYKPLGDTSAHLEGTIENLDKRTETLLKEVQQEFDKQNRANDAQLQGLSTLSTGLKDVLDKLSSSSQSWAAYGQKFDSGVDILSKNVDALSGNVGVLSQKIEHRSNGRAGGDSDSAAEVQLLRQLLVELQNLGRLQNCSFVQDAHTPQMRRTLDQILSVLQRQSERSAPSQSTRKAYSDSAKPEQGAMVRDVPTFSSYQEDEPLGPDQPKHGIIRRALGWVRHPFRRNRDGRR